MLAPPLAAEDASTLNIPIQGTNEWVVLSPDAFPSNPYDLIYLLKVETAPRSAWLQAAATYLRLDNLSHCVTVLDTAVSDAVDGMLPKESLTRLDLLASLAGAHIMLAAKQTHHEARDKHLREAADVFSRADTLDMDYPAIWAARGWADFHAGKALSSTWFDHAMDNGLVLGAIGLAALYLNRSSKPNIKRDPISLLVSALRAKCCPPGVWTGLAYALYKEGRLSVAKKVAVRAITALKDALEDERREAFYLFALINSVMKEDGALDAMSVALAEAYQLGGQRDSRVLSLIAHMFFSAGDFAKAESFAKRAVEYADEAPGASLGSMFGELKMCAKAEAMFQLARAQHHLGLIDDAVFGLQSVKELCDADSSSIKANPGALLRLGLLKLAGEGREDEQAAQECLERVLKLGHDRDGVAKRALGVLIGRRLLVGARKGRPHSGETFDRAVDLLKQGIDDGVDGKKDVPAQLVYAGLVEEFYPKKALTAYREAVATMQQRKEDVDPEIWNNLSAILARLGEVSEATEIAKQIKEDYLESCPPAMYNRGRLAEMGGHFENAERIYRSFEPGSSHHAEASVRLAIMLMNRDEDMGEPESLLKSAKESDQMRACSVFYLSKLYSAHKKFPLAQQVLESTRHECDYLSLAFSGFMHRFLSYLDEVRRSRFLTNHIGLPLVSMLKRNSRNAAAANGVGVYFAEWKMFSEARDAFVAAGSGPNSDKASRINLAHVQVQLATRQLRDSAKYTGRPTKRVIASAQSLYEQAVKLYSDALELGLPSGTKEERRLYYELLLYLAWAQCEARRFEESAKTLKKLVHIAPNSGAAWFNLGYALHECATERVRNGTTRLKEMEIAAREYEGSRMALQRSNFVLRIYPDTLANKHVSTTDIGVFERYVRQRAKTHDVKLRNAKNAAEDEEEKRQKRLAELKRENERQEEENREKEKERIKKEEELRQAFEESLRKQKHYEEQNQLLLERRQKKQTEDEDSPWEEEVSAPPVKKNKQKKKEEEILEDVKMRKRRVSGKRKVSDGSGSEYSDLPEEGEGAPNDSDEKEEDQAPKRRRFALQEDDDADLSEVDF